MSSWGWAGSVGEFLSLSLESWQDSLSEHHRRLMNDGVAGTQLTAWGTEYSVMGEALRECVTADPQAKEWGIVFEYELPLEGGRRPDVVVLAGGSILVLEFKSTPVPAPSQIDQVVAYGRDLSDYHEASHDRLVYSLLVLPLMGDRALRVKDTVVTGPQGLAQYLHSLCSEGEIDLKDWLKAPYAPLPTLVAAARRIFEHEPLPHVRSALAEGIPETIELIGQLIESAQQNGQRLMVLVTGVPGAGKTLVGLRLVYERSDKEGQATFLSGNGPLVAVLQDALKSRVFVRDLHAFIKTYGLGDKTPKEHILVFDEAQRAWDADYMFAQRGVSFSEPALLIQAGERVADWSALVGLVGEGQEIHSGEESGISQWASALEEHAEHAWRVHCPPKLQDAFSSHESAVHAELDLTATLRSRRAKHLHDWVRHLLQGNVALAARLAVRIQDDELYPMYLSRDLSQVRAYASDRYVGEPERLFGFVASSHAKNLKRHGLDNSFLATNRMSIAKWFNAPLGDSKSCRALTQPVTEFQCQGLELDLPIVCWGDDFIWTGDEVIMRAIRRRYPLQNPHQILTNTYRVLLTRGRDGLLVYIPDDEQLNGTERSLLAAGVRPLPETKHWEMVEAGSA